MKKVFYPLVLLFAASVIFTGCRNDDEGVSFTLNSEPFTTTAPWISSVRETTTATRTTTTASSIRSTADWVTISPESGGAGTYSFTISLAPNNTGARRYATIIVLDDAIQRAYIVQDVPRRNVEMKVGFSPLLMPRPLSPRRLSEALNSMQTAYYELDNRFSTLTSRQLTASHDIVAYLWHIAYGLVRAGYSDLSMQEYYGFEPSTNFKGAVLAGRGFAYFYLNTKFGGVPLLTDVNWGTPPLPLPPRATWNEVSEYIRTTLHKAIPLLECDDKIAKSRRVLALIALQKEEYQQAMGYLQQSIGVLSGIHIPTYLLYAETRLKIGQKAQAIARVNQVLQATEKELLPSDATDAEILAAIKDSFSEVDSGMKFLNAVRWGETESWGYRALLPIPEYVIRYNPNIVQNPGW